MAVPRDMQGIALAVLHNDIYYPPLFKLNKPHQNWFCNFRVAGVNKETIGEEYASFCFNGYGSR